MIAAVFAIFLVCFYQTLETKKAKYLDIIGTTPGLAFRPLAQNQNEIGVLTFLKDNPCDVYTKVKEVQKFLEGLLNDKRFFFI